MTILVSCFDHSPVILRRLSFLLSRMRAALLSAECGADFEFRELVKTSAGELFEVAQGRLLRFRWLPEGDASVKAVPQLLSVCAQCDRIVRSGQQVVSPQDKEGAEVHTLSDGSDASAAFIASLREKMEDEARRSFETVLAGRGRDDADDDTGSTIIALDVPLEKKFALVRARGERCVALAESVQVMLRKTEMFEYSFPSTLSPTSLLVRIQLPMLLQEVEMYRMSIMELASNLTVIQSISADLPTFAFVICNLLSELNTSEFVERTNLIDTRALSGTFQPVFLVWVEATVFRLNEWMQRAVENESWVSLSANQHCFSSLIDTFFSFSSAWDLLSQYFYLDTQELGPKSFLCAFVLSLGSMMVSYATMVKNQILKECPLESESIYTAQAQSVSAAGAPSSRDAKVKTLRVEKDLAANAPKQAITGALCAKIMALQLIQQNFIEHLEKYLPQDKADDVMAMLSSPFQSLRTIATQTLSHVALYMSPCFHHYISLIFLISKNPSAASKINQEFLVFLTNQLQTLYEHTNKKVFKKIVLELFVEVIRMIETELTPPRAVEPVPDGDCAGILTLIDNVCEVFHGDGEGLDYAGVEEATRWMRKFLVLQTKDTDTLLGLLGDIERQAFRVQTAGAPSSAVALPLPATPAPAPAQAPSGGRSMFRFGKKKEKPAQAEVQVQHLLDLESEEPEESGEVREQAQAEKAEHITQILTARAAVDKKLVKFLEKRAKLKAEN
eukprot:TRINITY_DN8264_c0_g1_i1.p1 TRINITY_DN8264_c0_g1~~TRINITY_DN8264_c0_g1_i1.p1  ORF type:complete len:731 (-),score=191.89 TRINITY_DN8264_c0_g1_i1:4-2196(-)